MKSVGLLRRSLSTASARHFQACASANPAEQGAEDVGKLYSVSAEAVKALRFADTLPKPFAAQVDTLAECAWLCRGTLLETVGCLKAVRPDFPALRLVLYGQMGTGKSVTLHQAVHFAFENQWVVWHVPRVLTWLRVIRDVQANQRKKNRVDTPEHAVNFLALFKSQNARMWPKLGELTTERQYDWSNVERTAAGAPITELVEMGLSAPFSACDCVGALGRELRRHASAGAVRVLVAVDQANSLYSERTLIKKADFSKARADEVSLALHVRRFLERDWRNGACLLVADKAEFSRIAETLDFPLNTPLELFGEAGFDAIDPFVPLETLHYSRAEADALHDYYVEKRWLATEKARSQQGRDQLYFLSGCNPYLYERLCAFN